MKILWINHRDPTHPEAGGAEVHILEVGRRLVQRGHDVTLLAEQYDGSSSECMLDGIRIRRMGGRYLLHALVPLFVKKNSNKYDIIVDDVAHAVPFWSPKFTDVPVAAIIHHVHQNIVDRELPCLISPFVKRAERSISTTYKNIIAISETTKKDLIEKIGVKDTDINVVHLGVDHLKYRPGNKCKLPMILWMGRMQRYKNPSQIVEAFSLVKKEIADARLVFTGKGEEEATMKSFVAKKGLTDVLFAGWVSEEEKVRLLQEAWCLVYTSDIEGWGMGILEANACGTTAVAYDRGALRETIVNGETGLLVRYADIDDLALKITDVLQDNSINDRLSKTALDYSHKFDWEKTSVETEECLESIL